MNICSMCVEEFLKVFCFKVILLIYDILLISLNLKQWFNNLTETQFPNTNRHRHTLCRCALNTRKNTTRSLLRFSWTILRNYFCYFQREFIWVLDPENKRLAIIIRYIFKMLKFWMFVRSAQSFVWNISVI